jgi:hypothetical protein
MRLETARHWVIMFPYDPEIAIAGHGGVPDVSADPALHTQTGIE